MTKQFFEHAASAGLRFAGWADDHVRLRHTGWFTNHFFADTFRGAVFRLPGKRGRERFVSGYAESWNDGFVIDLSEVWTDDLVGAAYEADRLAERAAEDEREYHARDAADLRIGEIADELVALRHEVIDLCQSIRAACPAIGERGPVRKALRTVLESLLDRRSSLQEERDGLRVDFWAVVR